MDSDDIYDDLNESEAKSEAESASDAPNLEQYIQHIKTLNDDIAKLCNELVNMKKKESNLKKNISELYNTAKAEMERKDRTIAELRRELDNMKFRRQPAHNRGNHFDNRNAENHINPEASHTQVSDSANSDDLIKYSHFIRNDDDYLNRQNERPAYRKRSRSRSRSNERDRYIRPRYDNYRNKYRDRQRDFRNNRHDRGKREGRSRSNGRVRDSTRNVKLEFDAEPTTFIKHEGYRNSHHSRSPHRERHHRHNRSPDRHHKHIKRESEERRSEYQRDRTRNNGDDRTCKNIYDSIMDENLEYHNVKHEMWDDDKPFKMETEEIENFDGLTNDSNFPCKTELTTDNYDSLQTNEHSLLDKEAECQESYKTETALVNNENVTESINPTDTKSSVKDEFGNDIFSIKTPVHEMDTESFEQKYRYDLENLKKTPTFNMEKEETIQIRLETTTKIEEQYIILNRQDEDVKEDMKKEDDQSKYQPEDNAKKEEKPFKNIKAPSSDIDTSVDAFDTSNIFQKRMQDRLMNKNKDSRKPKKLPIPGEGRVSSYLLSKLGHSDNSNALSQGKDGELPSLKETNTSNIENKSPKNEENCLSSLNDSFPTPHDESVLPKLASLPKTSKSGKGKTKKSEKESKGDKAQTKPPRKLMKSQKKSSAVVKNLHDTFSKEIQDYKDNKEAQQRRQHELFGDMSSSDSE